MSKKKIDPRIAAGLVALQVVIGAFTVRDIAKRSRESIRGPKLLWQIWGGSNTLGSVAYWLIGRKRSA